MSYLGPYPWFPSLPSVRSFRTLLKLQSLVAQRGRRPQPKGIGGSKKSSEKTIYSIAAFSLSGYHLFLPFLFSQRHGDTEKNLELSMNGASGAVLDLRVSVPP